MARMRSRTDSAQLLAAIHGLVALAGRPAVAQEPLRLHPANSHCFQFRGRPTVLVGCGEHYGAVLNLDFDFKAYFDEVASHKLNHIRLFAGTYREVEGSFGIQGNTLAPARGRYVCPWARSATPGYFDGTNRFDLERWDEEYFRRLRKVVREAGQRGIVVEVNLFCTMYDDAVWKASPMNAANNTAGIGSVDRNEVYALKERALVKVQEEVTRKIVGELRDFDNVYFEVINEPYERGGFDPEWERRILAAIVQADAASPRRHLISVNHGPGDARVEKPYPEVSIYNFHAATPQAVTANWALDRVIGFNETGGSARDDRTYRAQGWEFLLAGGALFSHLDFSFATAHPRGTLLDHRGPGGGSPALRRQLGVLRAFIEGFDFVRMKPDASSIAGGLAAGTRAQALAERGKQYAVYVSGGKRIDLRLDLPAGGYRVEWVDPRTGETTRCEDIEHGGGVAVLASSDFEEDVALRVVTKT